MALLSGQLTDLVPTGFKISWLDLRSWSNSVIIERLYNVTVISTNDNGVYLTAGLSATDTTLVNRVINWTSVIQMGLVKAS